MHRVPAAHDQIPIRKQVVLVQLGPCNRKFTLLWWKRSIENLASANANRRLELVVIGVEVRRPMLPRCKVHANHDAETSGYSRHCEVRGDSESRRWLFAKGSESVHKYTLVSKATNLAACVFHAMIHRESPVGLPNRLTPSTITPNDYGLPDAGTVDVPAVDATFLQEEAWKAAEQWR